MSQSTAAAPIVLGDLQPNTPPPQYPIESVDNALKLLLLFGQQPRVRLTDAAQYLGVASSTAHRLLAMLTYRGFVRQEASSRAYVPGGALTVIAASVARHGDERARVRPALERLSAEFRETASLSRLQGTEINFLDAIEGDRAVRVSQRSGVVMPAHWTSSGKAALSQLSDDTLRTWYPDEALTVTTDHTVATRTRLLEEIVTIRERGYATSVGESEDGVAGVAVPIRGLSDIPHALAVSVPVHRMTPQVREQIVARLTQIAAQLRDGSL